MNALALIGAAWLTIAVIGAAAWSAIRRREQQHAARAAEERQLIASLRELNQAGRMRGDWMNQGCGRVRDAVKEVDR